LVLFGLMSTNSLILKNRVDLSFFRGKKVFITGHTGFKGSWLSLILSDAGALVAGFALPPKELSLFNLISLGDLMTSEIGNIRDNNNLSRAISEFQPDVVFHLAAQALVGESYADPVATFETNILGSVNLLDAVRKTSSIKSLVFITSDKCYENNEWTWGYRENDRLGGSDPYSASKASAELIFQSFCKSFFNLNKNLWAASARAGNVIGGGDWSQGRLIPDCMRSIEKKDPVQIRAPKSTRPWQHVFEPLSGYLKLAIGLFNQQIENYGAWNFGPSKFEGSSVEEIVNLFHDKMGLGSALFSTDERVFHEAGLLQLNCDKAFNELAWTSRWSTEKAVAETAVWFRAYLKGESIIDLSRRQIGGYFGDSDY
jgi:CDP-glucose 4,6-dehydratase